MPKGKSGSDQGNKKKSTGFGCSLKSEAETSSIVTTLAYSSKKSDPRSSYATFQNVLEETKSRAQYRFSSYMIFRMVDFVKSLRT